MEPYADPQDTLSREEARERLPSHLRQAGRTHNVLQGKLPTVSSKVYDQPQDSRLQVVQGRPPDSTSWKQQQPLPKRPLSSVTSDSGTVYEDVPEPTADSTTTPPVEQVGVVPLKGGRGCKNQAGVMV